MNKRVAILAPLILSALSLATSSRPADAGTIYVKESATGANNGTTWTNAYTNLQSALGAAVSGDEIWVAMGTYKPTSGTDRTATFQLTSGVAVYGGFAGTETLLAQRNCMASGTVLSGDIGIADDNSDNSYHVVTGSGTDSTAVLDGLTVTAGRADFAGAGMENGAGSPTLVNVTFSNNAADYGAGLINWGLSNPKLLNVIFSENSAVYDGGGMYNADESGATLTNVVFWKNSAGTHGGGMFNANSLIDVMLTNVTFSRNFAGARGGGIYNDTFSPTLTNVILWGDSATTSGDEIYNAASTPLISYSLIDGSGGSGGGWDWSLGSDGGNNIDVDPLFVGEVGGNLRLSAGSPAVDVGDNAAPNLPATDLDRNPRVFGGAVDLGAYEYGWTPPPQFTEVSVLSGTDDSGNGWGVAWGDYNNDGNLDLYVANSGGLSRLYQNSGDGTFAEVGVASGTAFGGTGVSVAWGDYDNDGDLDLYAANLYAANRLYRNNGDGTFTDVAAASGTDDPGNSNGVAWGDYNNDGDLDLYVANNGGANRLYRSNGDGTFTDVAAASGTDDPGNSHGVAWGDYDNDGDLDLYVANISVDRLYQNNGDGTFTDVAVPSGASDGTNNDSYGVAWGDYDKDGDLDLYQANYQGPNRLYRNNGNGTFVDVGVPSGTDDYGLGVAWGDYDNDGDLDLYLTNGAQGGMNRLYRNNDDGTFTDVAVPAGAADAGRGTGVAWGDYDNDGDIDLYLANEGDANRLFRNDIGACNHWLHLDLVGTVSNRSGIGARVRCVAGGESQILEISGSSGFASQNSPTAEFGVGTATTIDSLEIRWPSGIMQTIVNPGVDHRIAVTEPGPTAAPPGPVLPSKYALHANTPNPFNPATSIRFDMPDGGAVDLRVYDVRGRLVRRLLNGSQYAAGRHEISWDGRNEQGNTVASGIYFYRVRINEFVATRRMVLLK